LPEFVTINRMFRGRNLEMITVSADDPAEQAAALEMLQRKHVSSKNYLFNSDSRDALYESIDPESQGGVPYTVLISPEGKVVYRRHGEFDPAALKKAIADHLGRTYASR
jgi:hypothetical protein